MAQDNTAMAKRPSILTQLVLLVIRAYQYFISPLLGPRCRFYPSCSEYFSLAIKHHGVFFGSYLGIKRLLRCHPGCKGGIDEVPTALPQKVS